MFDNLISKIIRLSAEYVVKTPNFIDFLEVKKKVLRQQDKYYVQFPTKYPRTTIWDMPYYQSSNQAIISFLGNVKSKLILDLGSGIGVDSRFLSKKGASVVSLDSSEKCLEISQKVNKNLHIRADAAELPFKDNVFNIVFGRDILHHLDEKACLIDIKRILKNDGYAVFIEPLKFNPLVAVYRLIKKTERVPQHPFSVWYLSDLSKRYFKKCEVKYFHTILPFFYFFMLYFPKLNDISSSFYTSLLSRIDDSFSNIFPNFAWTQVIKFYK